MIRPIRAVPAAAVLGLALAAAAPAQTVRLTASDGTVLSTEVAIGSVLIADPDVANVQPLASDRLFLIGKEVGTTTLFILDEASEVVAERRVVVTQSLAGLGR